MEMLEIYIAQWKQTMKKMEEKQHVLMVFKYEN